MLSNRINLCFTVVLAASSSMISLVVATPAANLDDKIFLNPSDLPKGFKMTESHLDGLSDSPAVFAACHGLQSGLKVFQTDDSAPLQRVVDINWTFPTANDAQKFIEAASEKLSEGAPLIQSAKTVGEDCKAYGGENKMGALLGSGSFYDFYYIFRSGRVVVKLYGSEGATAKTHPNLAMLLPIAQAAAGKCQNF
jgi:hypothetical protein